MVGVPRAIDYSVCDPRSERSVLQSASDKVPLAATIDKEASKIRKHLSNLDKGGYGYMPFEFVPFAFESSGAFSRIGCELWKEISSCFTGDNYIRQEKPFTWSAFTFQQMVPQRLSFEVNYWSARGSIEAIRRSRAANFAGAA